MRDGKERAAGRKPILHRSSFRRAAVSLLVIGIRVVALADGPPLTETEAVTRGVSRLAVQDVVDGTTDLARADEVEAGLWPNPSISYSREQTYGSGGTAEDYAWLSQAFDLSGRRGLRRGAAA